MIDQAEASANFFYQIIHSEVGSLQFGTFFHPKLGVCSFNDMTLKGLQQVAEETSRMRFHPTIKTWGWKHLIVEIDENRFVGANIQADVLLVDLFQFWGDRADLEIIDTMQFP